MDEGKDFFEEMSGLIEQAKTQPKAGEELDFDQAIEQVEGALETLNKELEEVCKQTGMTMEELEAYTKDPKNFTKEEWEAIEKIQGQLTDMQKDTEAPISQEAVDAITGTKKPKKKGKKRKGWVRG